MDGSNQRLAVLRQTRLTFLQAVGFPLNGGRRVVSEVVDLSKDEEEKVSPDLPRSTSSNVMDVGVAASNPPRRKREAPVSKQQSKSRHPYRQTQVNVASIGTNTQVEAHAIAASARLNRKRDAPQVFQERNQSSRRPQQNRGYTLSQGQGFFFPGRAAHPFPPDTTQPRRPNAQRQSIRGMPAVAGGSLPTPFQLGNTPEQQMRYSATVSSYQGTQGHQFQFESANSQQAGYPVRMLPPRQVTQGTTHVNIGDGRAPSQLVYAPTITRAREPLVQAPRYLPVDDNGSAIFCEPLGCEADKASLPAYIFALNSHLELFEVGPSDIQNDQGAKERICVGQIGIRCRYCKNDARFPKVLSGKTNSVEVAVEAIGRHHLTSSSGSGCSVFFGQAKDNLIELKGKHAVSQDSEGNIGEYYSRTLEAFGIYEGSQDDVGRALFRDTVLPVASACPQSGRPITQSLNSRGNQVMNGPTPGAAVPPFCWPLSSVSDEENLSEYYCFGRKQIEVFSWNEEYRRRNLTYVVKGQVGIRCKHCHHEAFPESLKNVHGRTMNLIDSHLMKECDRFEQADRNKLMNLKNIQKGYPLYTTKDSKYVQSLLQNLPICDHSTKSMIVLCNILSIQDV